MAVLDEKLAMEFASMADFSVDSVTALQRSLESAITEELLDEIAVETEQQIDACARRYGVSGLLMGEMGYYNPTRIMEHIYANVSRGRVLKKARVAPVFIYDFDRSGGIARVVNNDLHVTTYVLHYGRQDVCISVSNRKKEAVGAILCQRDNRGRMSKWIQFRWDVHMKAAYSTEAEAYQYTSAGGMCVKLSGVRDSSWTLLAFVRNEYSFELNARGQIASVEWRSDPLSALDNMRSK